MRKNLLKSMLGVVAAMLAGAAAPTHATAEDLMVGLGTSVTSIDPHFHNLASNIKISHHIYERLIEQDEQQRLHPGLATEWNPIEDTVWEFKLRSGVKFHDGSDFDAEDVAASIRRVSWVPNSPSAFTIYTRAITEITIVDPLTIRFKTEKPYPLMPVDLSSIVIVPSEHENTPTGAFNDGSATVGTGPFKFVEYIPGDKVELVRNDEYWGTPPIWQNVTLKIIPNDAARVAALLAGGVQAIDSVPPNLLKRLDEDPDIVLSRTLSNRTMFLHMDWHRDQTPFVTDKSGAPLPKNPFKDVRVREAVSKAIDRNAIVERIMDGTAIPAAGLLAPGFFGVSPNLKPDEYDPDEARRLLAEAGYPDGFAVTIHGPNDRYVNDEKLLQAIAPMLNRVGIETKVVAAPWATFIPKASHPNYAYSMLLMGNGATTGEFSFPVRAQLATVDRDKGMGTSNRARYSNEKIDALLAEAMATVDDAKREALLWEIGETADADQAVAPLFHGEQIYALRKGLSFAARADGLMPAHLITKAN